MKKGSKCFEVRTNGGKRYCQLNCVKLESARVCSTGKLLVLFPNRKFLQCTSIFKEINARRV